MKVKTHSGAKKRVDVRKSKTKMLQKSCKNHLLSNKSKRQKHAYEKGMPVDMSNMRKLRKLLPNSN